MVSEVQLCERCVMDTDFPGIEVYPDGTCSYCREYFRRRDLEIKPAVERKQALAAIIDRIRKTGRTRDYDAVIGLSGGMDSTYAAYIARQHGLRLLGVHVDNGWNTKQAEVNIRATAERLDIELVTIAPPLDSFRDLQTALLRASVPDAEIATDHVVTAALYQVAHQRRIRYLINGGNFSTEGVSPPGGFTHFYRDLRYIRNIHRRFGRGSMNSLPTMGVLRTVWYRYFRDIRLVRILNYVDYVKEPASKILEEEIGWREYGGKHNESVYTRFVQSYLFPKKFGVDKRRLHLSVLVCGGQATREEALAELEQPPYSDPELMRSDMDEVLAKLSLTPEELQRIMDLPVRTHRDYPSNRWLYDLLRYLARRGLRLGE